MSRRALLAAAAAASLAVACGHAHVVPGPAAPPRASEAPPVPLTSPEGHVEPDLVGVVHVVKRGETLYRIARTYGVSPRDLMDVNDLRDPRQLAAGTELFVPGATQAREVPPLPEGVAPSGPAAPEEAEEPKGSAREALLRWPVKGVLYSRFGVRQGQRHDGIDIAAPEGTDVDAAADGTVVYTGEQSGYGSIVIVRHPMKDLLTLYAHASAILVKTGDKVAAGQPIAKVGHSGRTTGPHLHFEVREGTRPRNPMSYLP